MSSRNSENTLTSNAVSPWIDKIQFGGDAAMFEEMLPYKRIGYIYPRWESDSLPYEMYHLIPDRIMITVCPVGLREFTLKDVERALAPIDDYIKACVDRECDIIVHGGVPLDLLQGLEKHDALIERIAKKSGRLATSTVKTILNAHKHMGIKKVVIVNKWSPEMNDTLKKFFEREGIDVLGMHCKSVAMADILTMKGDANTNLLYGLTREAFQKYPDTDAVCITGGSMISYPIIDPLEKEFGKPVITNATSLAWDLCHQLGCWEPRNDRGRLMASK
jgi:maleate cis-trans isomerase